MLKLSQKSLSEATAGKVVNLLANDVQRFDFAATALHHFWVTPLVVASITYLLWREVAVSSLAGILSMLLLTLPIQGSVCSKKCFAKNNLTNLGNIMTAVIDVIFIAIVNLWKMTSSNI